MTSLWTVHDRFDYDIQQGFPYKETIINKKRLFPYTEIHTLDVLIQRNFLIANYSASLERSKFMTSVTGLLVLP